MAFRRGGRGWLPQASWDDGVPRIRSFFDAPRNTDEFFRRSDRRTREESAASCQTTPWRRSRTSKARSRTRLGYSRGSAAGSERRRRRPPASAWRCFTRWPSGTTSAAGLSSSTSVHSATTIHACSPSSGPTPASTRLPTQPAPATRHEYFRRILCNLLGAEMRQGLLPDDIELVGGLAHVVCHDNAARYFGFATSWGV